MDYRVYLFDFDYTLADAESAIMTCYRSVLRRNGYPEVTDDAIKKGIGKGMTEIFKELTGTSDETLLRRYCEEYISEGDISMAENTFLYPSAVSVLTELKSRGKKLGIVSNKLSRRITESLVKYDITTLFDVVIGSEDMKALKPAPDGILEAMERLGCEKESVLFVGDSLIDEQTAFAAGVDFCAVTTGVTKKEDFLRAPVKIMTDLNELIINPERR